MSNWSIKSNVMRGAKLEAPTGWAVQAYDCEAMPCECQTGLMMGIPAAPVAAERRGERRKCLVCGIPWRVEQDPFRPIVEGAA